MTAPVQIPMAGVECDRCGQPALRVDVWPRSRQVVHLNPNVKPCPVPNPEAHRDRS